MTLKEFGYAIQAKSLPSFVHRVLVFVLKLPLMKIIDIINYGYTHPEFDNTGADYFNAKTLDDLEVEFRDDLRFDDNGLYVYMQFDTHPEPELVGTINIGDQCTHNGLYSAYEIVANKSLYEAEAFLDNYLSKIIVPVTSGNGCTVLRGLPDKDGASGDQIVDMTYAVHEYKKTGAPQEVLKPYEDLIDSLCENDFKIVGLDGKPTRHGMMNPSFAVIAKKISIICSVLLVAGKKEEFDYLWNDCGYKYLISHVDPYIKDGNDKYFRIFGKDIKIDCRDWFGSRIAGITLAVMYYHLENEGDKKRVKKALMKILNRDKWNTWIWLVALDNGVIEKGEIPQCTMDYFETFRIDNYDKASKLYPLGGQNTDFVWQRSPYKRDVVNAYVGKVDYLFAKALKDKYEL